MNFPKIPGFTSRSSGSNLASIWGKPEGEYPEQLWRPNYLQSVTPEPVEWLTVAQSYSSELGHGGRACVLVKPEDIPRVLENDTWVGRDVGSFAIINGNEIEDGLSVEDGDIEVKFFCGVREHHRLRVPSVDVSHPFLWYWDAIPNDSGWSYLNAAGRDEPLVNFELTIDSYEVQVRALELRHYLALRGLVMVVQHDHTTNASSEGFSRVDSACTSNWCNFTWHAVSNVIPERPQPDMGRYVGQYAISPSLGARVPRWEERTRERKYPEFQYDIDPSTGSALFHSCDPNLLGTYFDEDNSRLHSLTPIYFKPEVLARYINEPSRYSVTASQLTCLDLWAVDVGVNSVGLVEVYLGDLGERIPEGELAHWVAFNVPPAGSMNIARFRRDILNQPTAHDDPCGDVKRRRSALVEASAALAGESFWKELKGPEANEFEHLFMPVSPDPVALKTPIIILTTALVDALNVRSMRNYLGGEKSLNELRPLQLLSRVVEDLGGAEHIHRAFADLYSFRSSGGIAHRAGNDQDKVLARLGIAGLNPTAAFNHVCGNLAQAMKDLLSVMNEGSSSARRE